MRWRAAWVDLGMAIGFMYPPIATRVLAQRRCDPAAACPVSGGIAFEMLTAGFNHTCGISVRGETYCWGDGRHGALGSGDSSISRVPVRVAGTVRFVEVRAGGDYTCGRSDEGIVYCWGKSYPVPGQPRLAATPARVAFDEPAIALTAGRRHACLLTTDHIAYCWGFNADGEGGNGTSGIGASVIPQPVVIAGDLRWSAISAGLDFTCGLTQRGAAYCWGSNVDGVLGATAPERCGDVEPVPCASKPVRVGSAPTFTEIAAGGSHVCGRTPSLAVYCWGANLQGQAGASTANAEQQVRTPRLIAAPEGVNAFYALAGGGSHTCALANRGQLYCWGLNASGQLGGRSGNQSAEPVWSQATLVFMSVTAGGYHTCALTQRAAASCWGSNEYGALGRP